MVVLEKTLSGVRSLRDSCSMDTIPDVTRNEVEYLCDLLLQTEERMALAASQALANLAACGQKEVVWSALMTDDEKPVLACALESWSPTRKRSNKVRAAIIAAAHNCLCQDNLRARALAKNALAMDALLRNTTVVRDEAEEEQATASEEWTHILMIALLRAGATSFLDDATNLNKEMFEIIMEALEADAALFETDECEGLDVAVAACRVLERSKSLCHEYLDLTAFALSHGPPRRAELVTEANGIALAIQYLNDATLPALRVIANLCYHDPRARNEVRPAIPSILAKCATDVDRPLQREWALFAVRNFCQDNEENQAYIHRLQPQAINTSQETLDSLGLRSARLVEENNSKPRVKLDFARPPSENKKMRSTSKTQSTIESPRTQSDCLDRNRRRDDGETTAVPPQPSILLNGRDDANKLIAAALLNEDDFM